MIRFAIMLMLSLSLASAAPGKFTVGSPFPSIDLPALADGSPSSIAKFRGRKLLLHIFASW